MTLGPIEEGQGNGWRTGEAVRCLTEHNSQIFSLKFSPIELIGFFQKRHQQINDKQALGSYFFINEVLNFNKRFDLCSLCHVDEASIVVYVSGCLVHQGYFCEFTYLPALSSQSQQLVRREPTILKDR